MTAKIIDGEAIAAEVRNEVKVGVDKLKASGITPCLAAVLVGDVPASQVYVRTKRKACEHVGLSSVLHTPAGDIPEAQLLALIDQLNDDPAVHGILIQLPLPDHVDEAKVIERLSPSKDVDGFHPSNVGKLVIGMDTFKPCTPAGVLELLVRSGIEIAGKHAVVIGRSNIVGKPMANLLVQKGPGANATVTVCHSRTKDIASVTRLADILIVAMGMPEFITADMVKPGAAVIDVGINRVDDATKEKGYRLVGDVAYQPVAEVAAAITPVPGGVGPMTIAMLLKNTLQAAKALGAS